MANIDKNNASVNLNGSPENNDDVAVKTPSSEVQPADKQSADKKTGKKHQPSKKAPFSVVEAYKTIRTNLMFTLSQSRSKTITISSSSSGEGKSTTAVNIAIAFSQLDSKVLLIDADLRRPSIYRKMKLTNKKGLSSVIAGFNTFEESVNHINDHLDILTSGPTTPNPIEMLGSDAIPELLKKLDKDYDFIIFDTPPVNIVSDALVLAPQTDGLLLIVRENYATKDDFRRALSAAEFAGVRILGAVLNAANDKKSRKYGYRYKKYNYGYSGYGGYGYGGYGYGSYGGYGGYGYGGYGNSYGHYSEKNGMYKINNR